MSLAIFPILLALLLAIVLIVGIMLWITGGRSRGNSEMACGSCGYAVRGLESLHCPECGADLRMAGIHRPKGGAARNVGIALTIGTAFLLFTCAGMALLWKSSPASMQSAPTRANPPSVNQSISAPPAQSEVATPEDRSSDTPPDEVENSETSTDETDR